ncbi:MAG: hypothetical protein Q7J22_01300, partial [Candidatus Wolfebacteria bacterium]|nr:hypothetical protein [Candidatus Wolfebacteria bacterium]
MKSCFSAVAVVICFAASLSGFAATNSLQVLGTVALLSGSAPSGTVVVANITRNNQIGTPVAIGTDGSYATAEFHPFATIAADGDLIRVNVSVNGYNVTTERNYSDLDENSMTVDVQVDDVPPIVTGVTNNAVYRSSVAPVFNEGIGTLNGQPFVSGAYVNVERTPTLVVTDGVGNSTVVTFIIRFPNPPTFQTLSLEVVGDSVVLRWTADANFFQIERSEGGGIFLLRSSAVFGNEYSDSAITRGVLYVYRVTANRDELSLFKEVSAFLNFPVSDVAIRNSGLVIADGTITLEAAGSSGEIATVTVGGDMFLMEESPVGSGGYVATVSVPGGLAEGANELPATFTIGNATHTSTVSVTIDKTPPQPPVVLEPEPVSEGTLTLRTQAEPGSRVTADVSELAPDIGQITLSEVSTGIFEANIPVESAVSGERTVAITVTDRAGNVTVTKQSVTIQPEVLPLQFTLSLHTGVNLIYIPVRENGLERLSDLYSRLGGSTDVGSLVSLNNAGRFVSFTSSVSTGLLVDVPLGDSAVIAVMKRAKEVTFTGEAPSAEVRLQRGVNLVGVPRSGARMSDVAAKSSSVSVIIREEGGRFISYPPSNAVVRGGQGLIIVSREAATLFFDGEPWQNTAATAPSVSPLSYEGMT